MLKPWMAWAGDPQEGACLVFAPDKRMAKIIGFECVSGWDDCYWTDLRVRRLVETPYVMSFAEKEEPHAVDDLPSCDRCMCWSVSPIGKDGLCEYCRNNPDSVTHPTQADETKSLFGSTSFGGLLRFDLRAQPRPGEVPSCKG